MEQLLEWDRELFFFLNGLHSPVMDLIMWYISNKYTWVPLYLILALLIVRKYGVKSLLWFAGVAIALALSDQLTSSFMKPFFARWRPSRDPGIEAGLVHIVNNYRGGKYGFASSHAANAFAVALYIHLVLRPWYRWTWLLFIFAAVVSYSRIYLGVHYPGDLIVGGLIGMLCAFLSYLLVRWLIRVRSGSTLQ